MLIDNREYVLIDGAKREIYRDSSRGLCTQKALEVIGNERHFLKPLRIVRVEPGEIIQEQILKKEPYFGKRLKALRETRRVSQAKIGKELHIDPSTISQYEKGKFPSPDHRKRLADYFGWTVSDLFKG